MSPIYMACDWMMEDEDFRNHGLYRLMEAATDLNCDVYFDWELNLGEPAKRIMFRVPSREVLKQLEEQAGVFLGLTNWNEVSHEYFLTITRGGEIPSLQAIRERDSHYFGMIMEGLSMQMHEKMKKSK